MGRFRFERKTLPKWRNRPSKSVRAVHPSLARISNWVAVTFGDLDGDGLSNDLCLVDPRTDTVTAIPLGRTPRPYDPLELRPDPVLP